MSPRSVPPRVWLKRQKQYVTSLRSNAISLDVMGGDYGPEVVIPGAARALERHPDIRFVLFGIEAQCADILAKHPKLKANSTFHDCEIAVGMDEKPSQAYLDKVRDVFGFEPPRAEGHHSVESVAAMQAGTAKVFIGMGGNFVR
eukprot:gene2857-3702_t